MLEFQKQNCQLTLEEGLEVYYEAFEDQGSILRGDTLPEFIFGHDCTHVIFGLGLSLKEEAILDTYTIYGCKNSLKIIFKAAGQIFKSKELLNLYKKLISEHGLIGLLRLVNSSKKSKKIARIKTKKMKKKWSYIVPKSYLSYQISDLRDEYGISVLTEEELRL
tara:strand:+ start:231 stop:722 length:492 start_codon:yes stop_codon:yes gene_type:complete